MKADFWEKLMALIVTSIGIIFFSFVVIVFTQLMGMVTFYTPFIIVVAAGTIFFISNKFFRFLKKRTNRIVLISFIVVCMTAIIVHERVESYRNSFETLGDDEVDLYEYQAFSPWYKGSTFN